VFVAVQARLRQPLMRSGIVRVPNLAVADIAQLLLGAAWIPMFLFLILFGSSSSASVPSPPEQPSCP
jgi:hypothetical protein